MLLVPLFVAGAGQAQASAADRTSNALQGPTLTIVAHEDDDLIFISPDLLHAIKAGATVRTVYVTAGDDGMSASYWMARERGPMAAYALMAGTANSWTQSDAGVPGHPIPLYTLSGKPEHFPGLHEAAGREPATGAAFPAPAMRACSSSGRARSA